MPATPQQTVQPDPADRELLSAARAKQQAGQKLTAAESAAMRRFLRQADGTNRWRVYSAIPKKDYVRLSGRQHKILDDQARRYDMPLLGPTIDLGQLARWLHDFLARHADKLAREESDDPLLAAGGGIWREKYQKEKALLARLDRREREGTLVDRERSHQTWLRVAGILRRCGEVLQRQYGPAALRLLNQALEDASREVASTFGANEQHDHADDGSRNTILPGDGPDA
jgi:phage terminase Nu1 subunit (DNA packaging protein)